MNTRSKLLSIALSLAIAVGLCPAPACAADNGDGSLKSMSLTTQAASDHTADEAISWVVSKLGKPLDYDGLYGAQCVDLIAYYYSECLGVPVSSGHAYQYATNALPAGWTRTAGGKPQKGDILVWTNDGVGHVAIYESDFVTYHQNWLYQQTVLKETRYKYDNNIFGNYWGCIHPNFKDSEPHDNIWLDADGWYEFAPKCAPNRRLNIAGGSKDNGGNANIYIANDTAGQNFYVRGTTVGSYCILPKCSNKLLDLQWNSSEPGTNVFQWEDTGGTGQRWVFLDAGDGYVYIKANNGLFLDVDSEVDANDTNVKGWSYNGSDGQKWKMIRTSGSANKWGVANGSYVIQSATGSRVLDLPGGYTDNGTNVQIYDRNGSAAQTFEVAWDSKAELYTIKQKASGRSLDTAANANGVANLILYDYNAANGQRWFIEDAGGGNVYIRNRWGYYLDVDDGKDANGTNVKVFNFDGYKAQKWKLIAVQDLSAATVTVPDQTYTGQALTPAPTVKVGSATLAAGTDYTVSYKDNTAVGTATATVTGKGAYAGTKTATFKIAAPAQTEPTTPDKPINPDNPIDPTDPTKPTTLTEPTEPTTPTEPTQPTTPTTPTGPADQNPADGTDKGDEPQAGGETAKPMSVASATVTGVKSKTYSGKALTQKPTVKVGGKTLKAGADYTLTYANNVKAGKATMTITGQGAYTGAKAVTFTIAKANVKNATAAKVKPQKYKKGKAVKPNPKLTFKGKMLKKGTDYTLMYKNNKKRGTATITVKGKGNFQGSKTVKFKIK